MMNYSKYSVEDFILDESFRQWIIEEDEMAGIFWERWLLANPEKAKEVEKAREILIPLSLKEKVVERKVVEMEWAVLMNNPRLNNSDAEVRPMVSTWLKIAASVALILVCSFLYYLMTVTQVSEFATAFGETMEIVLPDQSIVTLNSNSSVSFSKKWKENEDRIVNLRGEAYFSVTHKSNNQRFIVRTGDLDVKVLGTEFNVNNRRGKVKVVLSSGKVQLTDSKNKELVMAPGELVIYSPQDEKFLKDVVSVVQYSGWKNNILEFNNTSVAEIATLLEDNYGKKVTIKTSSIAKRKFTGTYPANDITILIKALSEALQLNIEENGNKLTIEN